MIHAPLNGPSPTPYRSVSIPVLDNQFSVDPKILATGLAPFLPQSSPFLAAEPRTVLGSVPTSLQSRVSSSIAHPAIFGTGDNSTSLSGSSSLSSSLVSLHSTPPNGYASTSTKPSCAVGGSQSQSSSRCSLWLKLRVCPSWLATAPPFTTCSSTFDADSVSSGSCANVQSDIAPANTVPDNQSSHCPIYGDTCPYAHPTPNIRVEAGHVTVCYDFIKRKNCKHSCCKYYHPLSHQIEAILKRGDEQKKLLESQQRLLETKVSAYLTMQPSQPSVPSGLSTISSGACGSGLAWSPAVPVSVYGSYLSAHGLPTAFSSMNAFPAPFMSVVEPNTLNTSALLAAAAALQQHAMGNSGLLAISSINNLSSNNTGSVSTMADQSSTIVSCPTIHPKVSVNGHYTALSSKAIPVSESWYPSKRANFSTGFKVEPRCESEPSESTASEVCNGTTSTKSTDDQLGESDLLIPPASEIPINLPSDLTLSSTYCGGTLSAPQVTPAGLSNLLSTNLYGLSFSSPQAVASAYIPTQQLTYPSIYATQGNVEVSNANTSWLPQSQPRVPQLLPAQLPILTPPLSSNSSLAVALASLQQNAHSTPTELSGSAQSSSMIAFQQQQQQQQQQAALLSLFLRAQQSQLAAAQVAAAVHATGATGLLHPTSSPRPGTIGTTLPAQCMLDSTYPFPASLTDLCTAPYFPVLSCAQNPITNVAYMNEKGHLLETLPICRDFKAGKCHRNADCRYVHLVDENVEVNQGRVIVCRDAAKGRCTRVPCKYYHVPLLAISANRSLALNSALATVGLPTN